MIMEDWDQYRYFLAVAQTGSLSAAARELGVSQPTVSRRISLLEQRLEAALFQQKHSGMALTDVGREVLAPAEAIAAAATELRHKADRHERSPAGSVSLSAPGSLMDAWLSDKLREFRDLYPEITVECLVHDLPPDLARGDCDISLQVGRPTLPSIAVGSRVCEVSFGLFASRDYTEKYGKPQIQAELSGHGYIEATGHLAKAVQVVEFHRWMASGTPVLKTNCTRTYLKLGQSGHGLICIDTITARSIPDLVRVVEDEFERRRELWLLTHPALKNSKRVRVLLDYLKTAIAGCSRSRTI